MTKRRPDDAARVRRIGARELWVVATKWPLIALSIAFVVAYSFLVLVPDAPSGVRRTLIGILVLSWEAFIIDFGLRLGLTPRGERAAYVARHRIDLASAVLPLMRPFQLLKYLHLLPGFRGDAGSALRSRVITAAVAYAGVFIYVIALAVLQAERRDPDASITTFGQAIWWACVTVVTVGYGDYSPVTPLGRVLAVVLMAGGVAIIGTSSALIVSYLSERIARPKKPPDE